MNKTNRRIASRAAGIVAGAAIAASAVISYALFGGPVRAQNLGSPAFANPSEVRYRDGEKTLRAVLQVTAGNYVIPSVGMETLRQFRGWDPAKPEPALNSDISSGPTLRARLGDLVEISFLNKVDDSKFPYTFDTNSKPGLSSFGCDQSGTIYPGADKFPNCFHGSSTANIHFHGTHASPNGLEDNVLVQVLPQVRQPDWNRLFDGIFASRRIPQRWGDLPPVYRARQMLLVRQHDADAAAQARKNGLPAPESLWQADQRMINAGQWPQYLVGAFPNFFEIPDYSSGKYKAGQAPGTHWYHTHKHGATSAQIRNGLAGALVIESSQAGGYDHVIRGFYGWGNLYGDHEKIFVFQQFDPTQNLERAGAGGKVQVLVNGKLTPTITMRPGEVQLWRFINGTEGNGGGIIGKNNDLFKTAGFTFKQTAKDGVQFSPVNYAGQPFLNGPAVPNGLTLAGGERADLLVQAPPTAVGVVAFNSNAKTLFFVNVTGTPVTLNPAFPTTWPNMPAFLNDLRAPGQNDVTNPGSPVKFQWEAGRTTFGRSPTTNQPPHFMINNKQFEETGPIVDQCMPLNGLQDWVLENYTSIAHPFHIHINPFQVVKIETPTAQNVYSTYAPANNFLWQDVFAIPAANFTTSGGQTTITPGRVTIRQTFVDFTGTFVLHCHILAHEDRGMMQLVRVVPAESYPRSCQGNIPAHH